VATPKKAKTKPGSTRKAASGSTSGKSPGKPAGKGKSAPKVKVQAKPDKKSGKPAARGNPAPRTGTRPTGANVAKTAKPAVRSSGSPNDGHSRKAKSKPRTSPLSRALVAAHGEGFTVVEDGRKLPKTKLSRKELREFRELLLAKRRELVGNVGNLTDEALGRNRRDASGDLSAMPIHMADLGSDNWEQEFTLGLIDNERKLLREIDEALARIEDGTYGVCLATHTPITPERLRAKPWAKYCIEYARARESGRVQ